MFNDATWIWKKAGNDLTPDVYKTLCEQVSQARRRGGAAPTRSRSGDLGATLSAFAGINAADVPEFSLGKNSYVKFFGKGPAKDRALPNMDIIEDVADCESHWACSYPSHRAPRSLQDGDTVFIGRMTKRPNDVFIYGRAIACRHNPSEDRATKEDIKRKNWMADYSQFIRIHDAQFLSGKVGDGIRLSHLIETLETDAFATTQARAKGGQKGIIQG